MIDPHVHLRDWNQSDKETVAHGLEVAWKAGLDGVFEMPNTDPPLTSGRMIRQRIELADRILDGSPRLSTGFFHGVYAGLTSDMSQIEEAVETYNSLFPRVVGFKLFAGHSTGNLGVVSEQDQRRVFRALTKLGFQGVLAVHCEKEGLMKAGLWDPTDPVTHCRSRPPEAETESVRDIIGFAAEEGFRGTLHVCHISVAESVQILQEEKARSGLRLTCGVTPHHLLLSSKHMTGTEGLHLKMNPPLRSEENRHALVRHLAEGRITWIETDHAPHTLKEKLSGARCPSGIPGLPIYPRLIRLLKDWDMTDQEIARVTHDRIVDCFGIEIANSARIGANDLAGEYEFDPYRALL